MADLPEHPIWDFVRTAYGRPGVSPACLALQTRHGADVDLLLYAAWVGASGRGRLDRRRLTRLRAAMAPWQAEVVLALRSLRRLLKLPTGAVPAELAEPLRQRILGAEIESEHVQFLALAADAPATGARAEAERRADVAANLEACLSLFRIGAAGDDDKRDLTAIGAGCF